MAEGEREAMNLPELRRRAVHEAGHAVFLWRGGETIHGSAFDDRFASFREVLVSADCGEEGDVLPLRLEDGRLHHAAGTVACGYRLTVPAVYGFTGLPRRKHRALIARAKLEAAAAPGGILVSGAVHDATVGRIEAAFEDRGWLDLKSIERQVRAYAV
ncbi:MAG: hypothetical protein AB7F22_35670 [Reyranella sp.]|uniref:hypothetical protein n=1 Tax=Reyranella sp. TaxID=1929291 RepID=UPI003D0D8FC3